MNNKVLLAQLKEWRQHLHTFPETEFEEFKTAEFVAHKLREMDYEVHENIGQTGVVGSLTKGNSSRSIGLRAEMDALNITELTELPYASNIKGKMHACGHDGHVVNALGAAKLISEELSFDGTVRFIFQPAEEHGQGAIAMIQDGLFERFPIDEIYGLHNMPQINLGEFHSKVGEIMASEDNFKITINGKGGHSSQPHLGNDPLVIAAEIILSLQTIVARKTSPTDTAVVSCTDIQTDGIVNAIPSCVTITGDCRTYKKEVQLLIENSIKSISEKTCEAHNAQCEVSYVNSFTPTINSEDCHNTAVKAAKQIVGSSKINNATEPLMSSEDFGHFLEYVPGCFLFLGGREDKEDVYPLHHAKFDYKDDNLILAAKFFTEIVRLKLT